MNKGLIALSMCSISIIAMPAQSQNTAKLVADEHGQIEFALPSNNIECVYTPKGGTGFYTPKDNLAELSCSRVNPTYMTVILGAEGAAKKVINPGEMSCCSLSQVLHYGKTFKAGPFSCQSKKTGLTCRSESRHGFTMSRKKVTAY